jgi:hypothetical protein
MVRKLWIAAILMVLSLMASLGLGRVDGWLDPGNHSWGYVQQTRVVQG